MTYEQLVQHRQDENRGLSWREALSLWHTVHAIPTISVRYKPFEAIHFTVTPGRRYPTRLCHWTNFHRLHRSAFKHVSDRLARPGADAFGSRNYYKFSACNFMSRCVLDNRIALIEYQERTVEEFVCDVWMRMGHDRIRFKSREHHPLDDVSDRVIQMNAGSEISIPPIAQNYDKLCCITTSQGASRDLFVIEYQAASKLTPDVFKEGLHDMELEKIKERIRVPKENSKDLAEEAIAAVVTQTFDHMVDQGLSYGYLNGGNTFIFLFISPGKPQTLYYEKVILEAASTTSSIDSDDEIRLTAVGLVAGFTQMALGSQMWSEKLRSKARNELPIWDCNDPQILANVTAVKNRPSNNDSKSSEFKELDDEIFSCTSPAEKWDKGKARRYRTDCPESESVLSQSWKDEDSSGGEGRTISGISLSINRGQKVAAADIQQRNKDLPDRPYCTQACLLGLVRGHVLDMKCPNVQAHQQGAQDYGQNTSNGKYRRRKRCNNRHALDQLALVRLIERQLDSPEREEDGGFKSMNRYGWAGALFRLELLSHGYTFVGKGTVKPLVPVLHAETNMYKRMDTIQGKAIPVYLGSTDLISPFHLTTSAAIVYLMLLSWAGEEAWRCDIEPERLRLETIRTDREVAALGVQQGDMRRPNVLWNFELDRAILIDFDIAHINENFERSE